MTVTNFPKLTGVNEEFSPRPNVTNNPSITGVGEGGAVALKLLDEAGASAGAYSFKQLRSAYTGPVVEVRRDSDDVTQDFTAAQVASDLATFLDATQGYVVTWYDQSGNARDLVQATEADQPEVENDGTDFFINTKNGDFLRCAAFAGATTNMTMHILWQCLSDAASPLVGTFQGGIDFSAGTGNIFSPWWTGAQSPSWKGNGNTDFDWVDSNPRQHVWKWLNGTESCFEFSSQGRFTRAVANPTYERLTIGKNDIQNANCRFYELAFFPADTSATTLFNVVKSNYPSWFNFRDLWLSIGDSNTQSGFVTTGQQWTQKVYNASASGDGWFSRALGGNTLQHMIDNPERVTMYLEQFTCVTKTVILFLGTNDILNGTTAAQAITLTENLCDTLRAAGATRIIVITCLDRFNSASFTDAKRNEFNAGIIANANGKWDTVVDTTSNANLEDSTNATYFVDTTHLSATGQTELANMVTAVL